MKKRSISENTEVKVAGKHFPRRKTSRKCLRNELIHGLLNTVRMLKPELVNDKESKIRRQAANDVEKILLENMG